MAERAADSLPGLGAAAYAIGLEDHRRALHDFAQRVRIDHRMGLRTLGMEDLAQQPSEDDMGDIVICGDITNNISGRNLPSAGAPATPTTPEPASPRPSVSEPAVPGLSGLAKAAVIGSSLLGLGGIGAGALSLFLPQAPVVQPVDGGARVRVFWDDVEIKPGQSASAQVEKGTE